MERQGQSESIECSHEAGTGYRKSDVGQYYTAARLCGIEST